MSEIKDDKLELFMSPGFIDEALKHGNTKGINREALSILSDPKGRLILADYMLEGKYHVAPPTIQLVPKKNNEFRKVYMNEQMDRLVLSVVNHIYNHMYGDRIHPCCVSYQKGMGVGKIVRSIVEKLKTKECKGYKADLSKYFDNVNEETLFGALKELSTGSVIDDIVEEYYRDDRVIDENGETIHKYKSLVQGCAVSPFLANYVLRDIDAALSEMNIVYYRYSDDLLMIGEDADKALKVLEEMLKTKGLELNPKKISKISPDEPFVFLGMQIYGDKVTLSPESVENFKREIKKITKMRAGMKIGSRSVQKKAIKAINKYIYTAYLKNQNNFGWFEYFTGICNQENDYIMLDEFVKDHVKAMYTGKWNHTTNMHKTSNEQLEDMGYVSMHHMYKLYKINKDLYRAEVNRLML